MNILDNKLGHLASFNDEYKAKLARKKDVAEQTRALFANSNAQDYDAIAQGIYESGELEENNFFMIPQMVKSMIGIMVMAEFDKHFTDMHTRLIAGDYTDHVGDMVNAHIYKLNDGRHKCFECDTEYTAEEQEKGCPNCKVNTNQKKCEMGGADMYASAYEVPFTKPAVDAEGNPINIKVVIIECQSPMYAFVEVPNRYTGERKECHVFRLKGDFGDQCRVGEFLDMLTLQDKFDRFGTDGVWSPFGRQQPSHGHIVSVEDNQATSTPDLQLLQGVLFRLGVALYDEED